MSFSKSSSASNKPLLGSNNARKGLLGLEVMLDSIPPAPPSLSQPSFGGQNQPVQNISHSTSNEQSIYLTRVLIDHIKNDEILSVQLLSSTIIRMHKNGINISPHLLSMAKDSKKQTADLGYTEDSLIKNMHKNIKGVLPKDIKGGKDSCRKPDHKNTHKNIKGVQPKDIKGGKDSCRKPPDHKKFLKNRQILCDNRNKDFISRLNNNGMREESMEIVKDRLGLEGKNKAHVESMRKLSPHLRKMSVNFCDQNLSANVDDVMDQIDKAEKSGETPDTNRLLGITPQIFVEIKECFDSTREAVLRFLVDDWFGWWWAALFTKWMIMLICICTNTPEGRTTIGFLNHHYWALKPITSVFAIPFSKYSMAIFLYECLVKMVGGLGVFSLTFSGMSKVASFTTLPFTLYRFSRHVSSIGFFYDTVSIINDGFNLLLGGFNGEGGLGNRLQGRTKKDENLLSGLCDSHFGLFLTDGLMGGIGGMTRQFLSTMCTIMTQTLFATFGGQDIGLGLCEKMDTILDTIFKIPVSTDLKSIIESDGALYKLFRSAEATKPGVSWLQYDFRKYFQGFETPFNALSDYAATVFGFPSFDTRM